PAKLWTLLDQSYAIGRKYADDAEISQSVAEVEQSVKRAAKVDDLNRWSQLLRMDTALNATDGRPAVLSNPGQEAERRQREKRKLVAQDEKTKLFEPERKINAIPDPVLLRKAKSFATKAENLAKKVGTKALEFTRPAGHWSAGRLGTVAGVLILVTAAG